MKQITDTVMMVRPARFRMNEQTAVNNYYQKVLDGLDPSEVAARAQEEFDAFVNQLRMLGVQVVVVEDTLDPDTPDAVFPNNWISFHENGDVVLYPMFAENRRLERRPEVLDMLEEQGFVIQNEVDFTSAEEEEMYLEGTGSMILDREFGKMYCALSPRANEELAIEFCEEMDMAPILFTANQTVDGKRVPIYHTNVMMCIGDKFAVVCDASIDDKNERKQVLSSLRADGKEVVLITEEQVNRFAGNMLQVVTADGRSLIVMSKSAFEALTTKQKEILSKYGQLVAAQLDTIEACGGGSARCMLAEVFLPKA